MSTLRHIHRIERSQIERLEFDFCEFGGHTYYDLRKHFAKQGTEFEPSRKGLSIPADLLEDVRAGIDKMIQDRDSHDDS